MKFKFILRYIFIFILPGMLALNANAQAFSESFNDITTLSASGWVMQNNSTTIGSTAWFQGNPVGSSGPFDAYDGAPNAYIAANFNSVSGSGTISNWLVMPLCMFRNGDTLSFYTRKASPDTYADRLQVRLSLNSGPINVGAAPDSVGDFTTLLLDINPTLVTGVYPTAWTRYSVIVTGLVMPTPGRMAFHYYVSNGGTSGSNSDYIGIDNVVYTPYVCPVLNVNPDTLANGMAGTPYTQNLAQNGALGTPAFSVSAGALPPGLALSATGELSGIPTAVDTFNFTVSVSDASGCTGSTAYTMIIACPENAASFTVSPAQVCSNAGVTAISGGNPSGGTYAGSGIDGTTFDPASGNQVITYSVSIFGCPQEATDTIIVVPAPEVMAQSNQVEICPGDSVTLSGSGADSYQWNYGVMNGVPFAPLNTTIYTVSGIDSTTGCLSQDSIEVIVNELPLVDLPPFAAINDDNGPFTLTGGTPLGGIYSGTGVTGNTFDPLVGAGTYLIIYTYTNANGCVNADSAYLEVLSTAGMAGGNLNGILQIAPNPSTGVISLTYTANQQGPLTIKIISAEGKVVMQENRDICSGTYRTVLNLGHLDKGMYLLEVTGRDNVIREKFMLQ